MKKILITGGAGFIGSHVVRLFVNQYPDVEIHNLDKLTYAGNLENLTDIDQKPNYRFVKGDIVDAEFINRLFEQERYDGVIHLAAESHVDRSIVNPMEFIFTNVAEKAEAGRAYLGRQGQLRPFCARLPRHLRPADRHLQLLQQLWSQPVS